MPIEEIVGLTLLGELTYGFSLAAILLVIIGPTLALLYMIYRLYRNRKNPNAEFRIHVSYLVAAFLIILIDYRILKLFMKGLQGLIKEERLWVFRDFIGVSFVALAIYGGISLANRLLKARHPLTTSIADLRKLSKRNVLHVLAPLFALNVLVPAILGGWITFSLRVAYPQLAPLQTTWYELEAVTYIEENTNEKYVVIGDMWTISAGEVIVGVTNPRAYYFLERDKTGQYLFINMKEDPSPQWMLQAMNYTDTTIAYFIVTEPRIGTEEEYNRIVTQASQNLQLYNTFGEGKLHVFHCKKEADVQ
ncbi:MAG: hypothetical protein ACFE7I_09755 [Candidatus Hodarchaeota archaeon]